MSDEVVRVVAWRTPRLFPPVCKEHSDSTGARMVNPGVCGVCGYPCWRYDTVYCQPVHAYCLRRANNTNE